MKSCRLGSTRSNIYKCPYEGMFVFCPKSIETCRIVSPRRQGIRASWHRQPVRACGSCIYADDRGRWVKVLLQVLRASISGGNPPSFEMVIRVFLVNNGNTIVVAGTLVPSVSGRPCAWCQDHGHVILQGYGDAALMRPCAPGAAALNELASRATPPSIRLRATVLLTTQREICTLDAAATPAGPN